jgi:hypothetical protein
MALRLTQAFPGGGWNLVWSRLGTVSGVGLAHADEVIE